MNREDELLALVPPALIEADNLAAAAIERDSKRGLTSSCRRGCNACCRYLIRISVAEALYLRAVVASLPADHRERVLARSAAIRQAVEASELPGDLVRHLVHTPGDPGEAARVESLARRYLALDLSCPFLEDGDCSIYEHRPTPCRQYWVTSDAELCTDPFTNNARPVPVWPRVRDRLVRECAKITGDPPRTVPLAFLPGYSDLRNT